MITRSLKQRTRKLEREALKIQQRKFQRDSEPIVCIQREDGLWDAGRHIGLTESELDKLPNEPKILIHATGAIEV